MSLKDQISRFAEEARSILLEELAKKSDTKAVKNKGFDDDGNRIVQDGDQIKTANGLGQKYIKKDAKIILDNTGSVEYKKSKKKSESIEKAKKPTIVPAPVVLNREAIIFDDIEDAGSPAAEEQPQPEILEFPTEGFVVTLWKRREPTNSSGFAGPGTVYYGSDSRSLTLKPQVPANQLSRYQAAYPASDASKAVLTGRSSAGMRTGFTGTSSGDGFGFVNISTEVGGEASVSIPDIGEYQAVSDVDYGDIAVETQSGNSKEYINGSYSYSLGGEVSAEGYGRVDYFDLGDHRWTWQWSIGSRTLDLDDIIVDVMESECWHNYVNYEQGGVIAYAIFYVTQLIDTSETDGPEEGIYQDDKYIGQKARYWVHIKYNLTYGTYEKRTQRIFSTKDGSNWWKSEEHLIRYRTSKVYGWTARYSYYRRDIYLLNDEYFGGTQSQGGESHPPSVDGLFSNVFEGDWLYNWNISNPNNINYGDIRAFLDLSYKDGKWYKGIEGRIPRYWTSDIGDEPYVSEWEPPETSIFYNGGGGNTSDMTALFGSLSTGDPLPDFLDGTRGSGAADFSTWNRALQAWGKDIYSSDPIDGFIGPSGMTGGLIEDSNPSLGPDYGIGYGDHLHRHVNWSWVPYVVYEEEEEEEEEGGGS